MSVEAPLPSAHRSTTVTALTALQDDSLFHSEKVLGPKHLCIDSKIQHYVEGGINRTEKIILPVCLESYSCLYQTTEQVAFTSLTKYLKSIYIK